MHDDHFQKVRRSVLEQRGDTNLFLGLEFAALNARNRGVQPESTVGQVEAVVEQHFVDGRGVAQVFLLQVQRVGVQRLVALHIVAPRITLVQVFTQTPVGDQLAHLILELRGIGLEVLQHNHGRATRFEKGAPV